LLAGTRFLLFPIQWEEPFGLVMAEALACGTPVVATAMEAAPEIVEDGEVGVLVGAGEWDEMVSAIRSGRLDTIVPQLCREHVQERFSVETMLDGYEAAFEKILIDSRYGCERATVPEALPAALQGIEQPSGHLLSRPLVHDGHRDGPQSP